MASRPRKSRRDSAPKSTQNWRFPKRVWEIERGAIILTAGGSVAYLAFISQVWRMGLDIRLAALFGGMALFISLLLAITAIQSRLFSGTPENRKSAPKFFVVFWRIFMTLAFLTAYGGVIYSGVILGGSLSKDVSRVEIIIEKIKKIEEEIPQFDKISKTLERDQDEYTENMDQLEKLMKDEEITLKEAKILRQQFVKLRIQIRTLATRITVIKARFTKSVRERQRLISELVKIHYGN